jgi:hypothetical protein
MVLVHLIEPCSILYSFLKVFDFKNSSTVVASKAFPSSCFHYDTGKSIVTVSTSSTPIDIFFIKIRCLQYLSN